ncbi:MAG: glutamate--tRNA ligase [Proteobacteria bacterium]|nr:glutamate--tRNA ligase [Pseudomonadota bacterium]
MTPPVTRFAPSPSGFLHIGGARTALFCWLLARRHGGRFILRIEDTNQEKSTDESIAAIVEGMRWLGLDWDEGPDVGGPAGPYRQSMRKDIYTEHVGKLLDTGHAYRCYCTREELDAAREQCRAEGRRAIYQGTCRNIDPASWDGDERPYVWRLRVPLDGEVVVDDLVKGPVTFPNAELGDMVIVRSNGDPLYNFVVVVDDHTMNVTHVVRGDDHLANTPKQILIYNALGLTPPKFAHVPLILGEDKKRLSKRHGATNVMSYSEEGYLPDAMVNFLARLGWSHGDQELFTRAELIDAFSLEGCGKSPGVWNPGKLLWTNHQWMMRTDSAALAEQVGGSIEQIDTLKERARTVVELRNQGAFYWNDEIAYEPRATKKFLKAATLPALEASLAAFEPLPEWNEAALETAAKEVMERLELGMGKIAQPLRVAVTGTKVSPGIFETLSALGRDKSITRIKAAIDLAQAAPAPAP